MCGGRSIASGERISVEPTVTNTGSADVGSVMVVLVSQNINVRELWTPRGPPHADGFGRGNCDPHRPDSSLPFPY